MQKITNKEELNKVEQKMYGEMWDSEFLALLFANVLKTNPDSMSEYTFNRLDKILQDMAKQEMI